MPSFSLVLLALALAAALPPPLPVTAASPPTVSVYNQLVSSADIQNFHVVAAFFTSDTVVSFAVDTGTSPAQLQNWRINETQPIANRAFSLAVPNAVDMDLRANHLAVAFDNPNRLVVFRGLTTRMEAPLLHAMGNKDYAVSGVSVAPRDAQLAVVWESEDTAITANVHERFLLVYSFAGAELQLVGSISSNEFGSNGTFLLRPDGVFHPTDPERYFAHDATVMLWEFKIKQEGNPELVRKVDSQEPFDGTEINSLSISQEGRFLAITYGTAAAIFVADTFRVLFRTTSDRKADITRTTCWSPNNQYLVVGTIINNTGIISYDGSSFQEVFYGVLPGSDFDSTYCGFSPTTSVFVTSSVGSAGSRAVVQNVTSYLISPTPSGAPPLPRVMNPTETPSSSAAPRACFPARATVALSSGRAKRMDQLLVGDEILVSRTKSSPVYTFSHRDRHRISEFVRVSYLNVDDNSTGHLTLSPSHYLYSNGVLTAARLLKRGDALAHVSAGPVAVVDLTTSYELGLYNPHTLAGDIVVDGIVASTFTEAVDPVVAALLLHPVRDFYRVFGGNMLGSMLDSSWEFASILRL